MLIVQPLPGVIMGRKIESNHQQGMLFPPHLDDLLPKDHPARFINEFVEQLSFDELNFTEPQSTRGRSFYSSKMLLKIWLFGLFDGIRSTRKLELACKNNIGLVWLTGMHYPDHNTIWRFWKNNKKQLKSLFKETVVVSKKLNLIGFALQAIDGTFIESLVNKNNSLHREELEKLLQELDKNIEEIASEIESNQTSEDSPSYSLPEHLQEKQALREEIESALDFMSEINRDHVNPKDPDCRMIKKRGKSKFGYNGQIAVDSKNQLIVAQDLCNDESDNSLLVPMLDNAKEMLEESVENTVADAGYFSGKQLHEADEKNYNVLVDLGSYYGYKARADIYPKDLFSYDKDRDVFICPHGQELEYKSKKTHHSRKYKYRKYLCKSGDSCPYRQHCTKSKSGRSIKLHPNEDTIQKQKEKQKSPDAKYLLSRRKVVVEPVFGQIKHNLNFRRFTVTGIEKVQTQWALMCTTYNLRKIYKAWSTRVKPFIRIFYRIFSNDILKRRDLNHYKDKLIIISQN